jgi:transposase InsO family protein
VKYVAIKKNENTFKVRMMCRVLAVSKSGYYGWRNRLSSSRAHKNSLLDAEIKKQFEREKGRAGAPRVTKQLKKNGISCSHNRVAKRMRALGLRAKAAKKFKATTNSKHSLPIAPNLLNQDFNASRPNQKWVSDITYIWTEEGWLYLAVIVDLYSRMVVGWSMSERMTSTLVCDALIMALFRRGMPRGVILHSDRGSQYCSHEYQQIIKEYGLICSMSKKGDCYDNAAMESWNHSLKVEAIHGERFLTRDSVKNHVFEYIEVYYNRYRLHSKIGYLSPAEFEEQKVA